MALAAGIGFALTRGVGTRAEEPRTEAPAQEAQVRAAGRPA
jgi:hypothetical protein